MSKYQINPQMMRTSNFRRTFPRNAEQALGVFPKELGETQAGWEGEAGVELSLEGQESSGYCYEHSAMYQVLYPLIPSLESHPRSGHSDDHQTVSVEFEAQRKSCVLVTRQANESQGWDLESRLCGPECTVPTVPLCPHGISGDRDQ